MVLESFVDVFVDVTQQHDRQIGVKSVVVVGVSMWNSVLTVMIVVDDMVESIICDNVLMRNKINGVGFASR